LTLKTEITEQIRALLQENPKGLSITAITRKININRNTAGRYLENLMVSGQVEMRHFGMAKIYKLAQRVPLNAMLSITSEKILLLDNSFRVIYANEPMLAFLKTSQKDLYGKNIEFTSCVTVFDDAFELLKKKVMGAIDGNEWSGEIRVHHDTVIFTCRIAPTVFEQGQRGASIILDDITIHKKAEEAIRKSELEFRMLAENSLDMIERRTPDGIWIYVSPASRAILGCDPKEIIGHPPLEFLHPDDKPRFAEVLARLTRAHPDAKLTCRLRHRSGRFVWIESSLRAIFNEKTGEMIEIYGVTRDITDRITAEDDLRESEDRYRTLVEISPDAILLHQDGKIIYLNPAAMRLIRANSPGDIIGRDVIEIIHPAFREKVKLLIQKDLQGDLTPLIELMLVRLDGTPVPAEGRGARTMVRGSPAVQVTLRDITERKQAEETLRRSEERSRSLAEVSHDLIFVIDRSDRVEFVNSHAAAILGRRAEELIGCTRSALFPGELGVRQAGRLNEVFETGRAARSEGAIPVDGQLRWFDHYLMPITDAGGSVISVLGISRDITERRAMEMALQESEATARALISAPTDSVLLLDEKGVILEINDTAAKKLGRVREELIGSPVYPFLPESIARSRHEIISRVFQSKEPVRFDDARNGFWFDTVVYPITDSHGKVIRFAIIARDITERKKIDDALKQSEERFRDLITTTPDIVWEADDQARFAYISPQVERVLGYRPEELIGRSPFGFVDPAGRAETRAAFDAAIRNNEPFIALDTRWLHKDGHTVVIESRAKPVFRSDGSFAGLRGIDRDVTEHRKTVAALEDVVRDYQTLAENSVDIISRILADGTCRYVSPAVRRILGYEPGEVTGQPGFAYLHPDDLPHVIGMVRSFEEGGNETGTDRFRMRHKDGSYVWLDATIRATRDRETVKVTEFTMVSRLAGPSNTNP